MSKIVAFVIRDTGIKSIRLKQEESRTLNDKILK